MFRLMVALIATSLCVGFASCGDDDDDNSISSPIVKTWVSTKNANETFTFQSNGRCRRLYQAPAVKGVTDNVVDDDVVEQYFDGTYLVSADNSLSVTWTMKSTTKVDSNGKQETTTEKFNPAKVEIGDFTINGNSIEVRRRFCSMDAIVALYCLSYTVSAKSVSIELGSTLRNFLYAISSISSSLALSFTVKLALSVLGASARCAAMFCEVLYGI